MPRVFYEHSGKATKVGAERVLSILEILEPKEVCSETYVVVDSLHTQTEGQYLYDYLKTKFARFLILQASSSIMITRGSYQFVPALDFKEHWTDKKLFDTYKLTEEEIDYIDSTIKPMDS
ncbi:MAG: hypothetical protein HUJ83_10285 [Veillonella sp.]|nr:hypothetical protein [Veillonella sp.]